jgi:ankyrin repeat protein
MNPRVGFNGSILNTTEDEYKNYWTVLLDPTASAADLKQAISNINAWDILTLITASPGGDQSAMHVAARLDRVDFLRTLEIFFARNPIDKVGRTPFHYARSPEAVAYLAKIGENPNHKDNNGATPLHTIAMSGSVEAFTQFLQCRTNTGLFGRFSEPKSPDIRLKDNAGRDVLAYAVADHNTPMIQHLLNHYAGTFDLEAAVKMAVHNNHYDTVELLCKDQPKLTESAKAIISAHELAQAAAPGAADPRPAPLHRAAALGNQQDLTALLNLGFDANPRTYLNGVPSFDDRTPLHIAAVNQQPTAVEALLAHGADVSVVSGAGKTALCLTRHEISVAAFTTNVSAEEIAIANSLAKAGATIQSQVTAPAKAWLPSAADKGEAISEALQPAYNRLASIITESAWARRRYAVRQFAETKNAEAAANSPT